MYIIIVYAIITLPQTEKEVEWQLMEENKKRVALGLEDLVWRTTGIAIINILAVDT